jgi:hypothetical protein
MTISTAERPRPTDLPQHAKDLYFAELDGETVIFSETTGELTLLDPVGTVTWHLLDGLTSVEQLSLELAEAFGAPHEQVRADVSAMLCKLEGMRLVVLVPGTSS